MFISQADSYKIPHLRQADDVSGNPKTISYMTGTLAQLITLTSFGNDYLINGTLPMDFYPANTTFQFCNKVEFKQFKKTFFLTKPKEIIVAKNPILWFNYLKIGGCKKLRLYFQPSKDQSLAKDHKLAGMVGGGGSWFIEAIYENYSNGWVNSWEVTRKDDPDNKIWTVNYILAGEKLSILNFQYDQKLIKEKLKQTLTEIEHFAFGHNLKDWGKQFENAKAILDSDNPNEKYYHKDLIAIENYSTIAKQILFSAGSAWVFGGMGSWNDLGFENSDDNELYENLSEQLYSNINEAIISAINSY